jgi:hypothetical protein
MSRPGYWRSGGGPEVPITELEDSHIKNIMRYVRRSSKQVSGRLKEYWDDHLAALGNEAQRRNIIVSGDLTMDDFNAIVDNWQIIWDLDHPPRNPGTVYTNNPYPGTVYTNNPYPGTPIQVITTSSSGPAISVPCTLHYPQNVTVSIPDPNSYQQKYQELMAALSAAAGKKQYYSTKTCKFSDETDIFAEIATVTNKPLKNYNRSAMDDIPERRLDFD